MEFCDNKKQLFQAYFRDFTIERLESPWQAFTGGWYVHTENLHFFLFGMKETKIRKKYKN